MEFKQVILVRKDVKMGKGKLAVQVAHASLSAALKAKEMKPNWFDRWIKEGQPKIVLKVENLEELYHYLKIAEEYGLPLELIRDSGLTQLRPGTVTCLGIGPAPSKLLDEITGELKLL